MNEKVLQKVIKENKNKPILFKLWLSNGETYELNFNNEIHIDFNTLYIGEKNYY